MINLNEALNATQAKNSEPIDPVSAYLESRKDTSLTATSALIVQDIAITGKTMVQLITCMKQGMQ